MQSFEKRFTRVGSSGTFSCFAKSSTNSLKQTYWNGSGWVDNDLGGGLFTGAEEIKTAEQQAIWGGTTGAQFDPCYHLACDTYANNNDHALDVNSDLTAFATLTFAFSTEAVNGVPGRAVPGTTFSLPTPAGPEGTFIP